MIERLAENAGGTSPHGVSHESGGRRYTRGHAKQPTVHAPHDNGLDAGQDAHGTIEPVASRLVEFYSGHAPDHAGRFAGQIQQWPDERLEAVHDFIQWLFPLAEPSPVNPLAPALDRETIEAFAARPELRQNLRESFLRMLRFYGLEMRPGPPPAIERGANFPERAAHWLHPGNHNHLRITRILKSLALLGLAEEAGALLECLETIRAAEPGRISAVSVRFWRAAIGPARI